MKYVTNIWIPLKNVNSNNTLKYVPYSHLIRDEDIKTTVDEHWPGKVKKFSSGHKIGFFWQSKKIVSGVDIENSQNMELNRFFCNLFITQIIKDHYKLFYITLYFWI